MEITLALMKQCYQFFQGSNSMNCHQTEGNIKVMLKTLKEDINNKANTKLGTDGQT